jgi:hypothetical protein
MRGYFHLVNGHGFIPDETGIDVPNLEMAQHQALKAIQDLRQEAGQTAEEWYGWRINGVDAQAVSCCPFAWAHRCRVKPVMPPWRMLPQPLEASPIAG